VILLLDPGLRRGGEQFEREFGLAFEHRHESTLDPGPEGAGFSVLRAGAPPQERTEPEEAGARRRGGEARSLQHRCGRMPIGGS
jgi:hypothetical protein